ncbi:MAG: phosphoenolpyruvate--protein phosphotransferase [Acidobacteria bacterium]|nr:phosphoenolpyruvate--protein phosphotransferase [Acidobacteriota bacterium]
MEAVLDRVIANLSGASPVQRGGLPRNLIIMSHDFNPSVLASMDLESVKGLALEAGGRTSHTAILARSLGIPAVMEMTGFLAEVATGDPVLLDGDRGQLVLNPTSERLDSARIRLEECSLMAEPPAATAVPARTRDGVAVTLKANTELPMEVRMARRCAAEGIGLFRSELLFLRCPGRFPTMASQLETYSMLAREMHPYPVAIRTLDLGGDSNDLTTGVSNRQNPVMGLRGIRWSLVRQDLFATQIEAILRAGASGKVELVLPMIASVEEVREAKAVIARISEALAAAGDLPGIPVAIGAMIEVPAAVLALDGLAREVDFLCVGTNDLTQYLLAVDRGNPSVSHLFKPLHPAMLQSLQRIAAVAKECGKPVRICGEMCANPFFAVLLLGMGFTELSMNSTSIPTVRKIIKEISLASAADISAQALRFQTAGETAGFLLSEVGRLVTMDLAPYVREVVGAAASDRATPALEPPWTAAQESCSHRSARRS